VPYIPAGIPRPAAPSSEKMAWWRSRQARPDHRSL